MHTCISSHGLKRSWRSCPRRVNAGNKNTPSQHAPSTKTECDYLNDWVKKRSHTQKSHPKVVNPGDIAEERKNKGKKRIHSTEISMIQKKKHKKNKGQRRDIITTGLESCQKKTQACPFEDYKNFHTTAIKAGLPECHFGRFRVNCRVHFLQSDRILLHL